mgnify:CR=1 FL=1
MRYPPTFTRGSELSTVIFTSGSTVSFASLTASSERLSCARQGMPKGAMFTDKMTNLELAEDARVMFHPVRLLKIAVWDSTASSQTGSLHHVGAPSVRLGNWFVHIL